MNSILDIKLDTNFAPRYSKVKSVKSSGATYTPDDLANFVAEKMLQIAVLPKNKKIRILDPAVGDGALLEALLKCLSPAILKEVEVFGYDTNATAIITADCRLKNKFPFIRLHLQQKDFLEHVLQLENQDISAASEPQDPFDLVIANPPYVRTQTIGANQAQSLAKSFGLTGRVDLYYPFLIGISKILADNGVAGVITSNRFITTKSGQSVRNALLSRFQIHHVWDLGDTKLFDAAVLPSVILASGKLGIYNSNSDEISFTSIYETKDAAISNSKSVFAALSVENDTVTAVTDGRHFRVRQGLLDNGGDPEGVWRIATIDTDNWLATVESNTWDTFRRIGKIRVGVKSTADKVFIRSDWDTLDTGRPELLKPLITRKCARRFKADIPAKTKHLKEILYPHEVTKNGRLAVDLNKYPKAAAYLGEHRKALESRKYLIDAGRKWYELWVPQDPAAWAFPKLVFPDISEKPIFWLDTEGGIVNGECYWLQCENKDEHELLWLALAVANSTFIEAYYDHRFNNKLYAGKRRFITQYVELFPLPNPTSDNALEIVSLAKEIHLKLPSIEADELAIQLDTKIWRAFGLNSKKVSG